MFRKLCHFIWGMWWFHMAIDFEGMKAGKLAICPGWSANIMWIRSWTFHLPWIQPIKYFAPLHFWTLLRSCVYIANKNWANLCSDFRPYLSFAWTPFLYIHSSVVNFTHFSNELSYHKSHIDGTHDIWDLPRFWYWFLKVSFSENVKDLELSSTWFDI